MAEKTRLFSRRVPRYTFVDDDTRVPKANVRSFHCCLCAAILAIFTVAAVATVSVLVGRQADEATVELSKRTTRNALINLTWPIEGEKYVDRLLPPTIHQNETFEAALEDLRDKDAIESDLASVPVDSPTYRAQMAVATTDEAQGISQLGYLLNAGAQVIQKRSADGGHRHDPRERWMFNERSYLLEGICSRKDKTVCLPGPYRTADGTCNNRQGDTTWGSALKPFRRILLPKYKDGIKEPRSSSSGRTLPSARKISLAVHRPKYENDINFTVMLAVWGQFIDHDMTATALSKGRNGAAISCCHGSGQLEHPECFTVSLEDSDPFYKECNVTCLEFVRSAPAAVCAFGPREQLNQVSSFLDGSVVYGSNDHMEELRSYRGGQLNMLKTRSGDLLPPSNDPHDGCNRQEEMTRGRYCFLSGDARSNENLLLTSMHLLWARHHNSLATTLEKLNPHWTDEKIFQETRKIVGAQIQHVTYTEFLPSILPRDLMTHLNLTTTTSGGNYRGTYDPTVDPGIANSFASAAFRFGHTLLPGLIRFLHENASSDEYLELHKMLFNPFKLYQAGFLTGMLRGSLNTATEKADVHFTRELTRKLFKKNKDKLCGLDLVSLNIQRGRDHGLPPYTDWRNVCGQRKPETFDDLTNDFDEESLRKLRHLYESVHDIDLYTGALAELPIAGGLLGPTFTCLIADQFYRLKVGDRFWYETDEKPQRFTPGQLNEIRKTTLAKIICKTSEIDRVQVQVMKRPGPSNEMRSCDEFVYPNLEFWKEEPLNRV